MPLGLERVDLRISRSNCRAGALTRRKICLMPLRAGRSPHHPYTEYSSVTDFIEAAAKDPAVMAIKICLYRTGKNSPIPEALIAASERGKQVTAVVEIKARFDEENNIEWAGRLAEAGVHVVYGLVKLKTHSKVASSSVARIRGCRPMFPSLPQYNPLLPRSTPIWDCYGEHRNR